MILRFIPKREIPIITLLGHISFSSIIHSFMYYQIVIESILLSRYCALGGQTNLLFTFVELTVSAQNGYF